MYKGGPAEYDRLTAASYLDFRAAYRSCSWGKFQIMGFNSERCGYDSMAAFLDDMYEHGEDGHLRAFVGFVKADPKLVAALRAKSWTRFARRYNGPGYAKNQYHTKMARAYRKFSK